MSEVEVQFNTTLQLRVLGCIAAELWTPKIPDLQLFYKQTKVNLAEELDSEREYQTKVSAVFCSLQNMVSAGLRLLRVKKTPVEEKEEEDPLEHINISVQVPVTVSVDLIHDLSHLYPIIGQNMISVVNRIQSRPVNFLPKLLQPIQLTSYLSVDRMNMVCHRSFHTVDNLMCEHCTNGYVKPTWNRLMSRTRITYEALFDEYKLDALLVWLTYVPEHYTFRMLDTTALSFLRTTRLKDVNDWDNIEQEMMMVTNGPVEENMIRLCVVAAYPEGVKKYWPMVRRFRKRSMMIPLVEYLTRCFSNAYTLSNYDVVVCIFQLVKYFDAGTEAEKRDLMAEYLLADLRGEPKIWYEHYTGVLRIPLETAHFLFSRIMKGPAICLYEKMHHTICPTKRPTTYHVVLKYTYGKKSVKT